MNIWFRRLFLVLSVGGGFAGFTVTISQLFRGEQMLLYYVICVVAGFAYLQGIVAGITFLEDEEKGLRLLFAYFIAQIPIITSSAISYMFSAGALAYALVGTNGVKWYAGLGGRWEFALLQSDGQRFGLGVNFVALWAAWYLRRIRLSKKANQPLPTPASVTAAAGAPVAPPPGAAGQ